MKNVVRFIFSASFFTAYALFFSCGFAAQQIEGDFNSDGRVNADDIDFLTLRIGNPAASAPDLDLTRDGVIDLKDRAFLIRHLVEISCDRLGAIPGDVNLDGDVDVLGDAFAIVSNLNSFGAGYADGDLNGDGRVTVFGDAFELINNLGESNCPIDVVTILERQNAFIQQNLGQFNVGSDSPKLRVNDPEFWATGKGIDYSGIGTRGEGDSFPITMISQQVGIVASHTTNGIIGTTFRFGRFQGSGEVVAEGTVARIIRLRDRDTTAFIDLTLAILAKPLGPSVTPYKTIDFVDNLPACAPDWNLLVSTSNQGRLLTVKSRDVFDSDLRCSGIANTGIFKRLHATQGDFPPFPGTPQSSSPSFLLYEHDSGERELALVETHWCGNGSQVEGASIAFYRDQINQALAEAGLPDRFEALHMEYDAENTSNPPQVSDIETNTTSEGGTFSIPVYDTNCPARPAFVAAINGQGLETLPRQGNFFIATTSNGGSVFFTGSSGFYFPQAGFTGQDSFTFTATNGVGEATGTVTINVSE